MFIKLFSLEMHSCFNDSFCWLPFSELDCIKHFVVMAYRPILSVFLKFLLSWFTPPHAYVFLAVFTWPFAPGAPGPSPTVSSKGR